MSAPAIGRCDASWTTPRTVASTAPLAFWTINTKGHSSAHTGATRLSFTCRTLSLLHALCCSVTCWLAAAEKTDRTQPAETSVRRVKEARAIRADRRET